MAAGANRRKKESQKCENEFNCALGAQQIHGFLSSPAGDLLFAVCPVEERKDGNQNLYKWSLRPWRCSRQSVRDAVAGSRFRG
jgi:hypothetical protein